LADALHSESRAMLGSDSVEPELAFAVFHRSLDR